MRRLQLLEFAGRNWFRIASSLSRNHQREIFQCELHAAIQIQRVWKHYYTPRRLRSLWRLRSQSTSIIQCCYPQMKSRKALWKLCECSIRRAITTIQATIRMFLEKKKYKKYLECRDLIVPYLQKLYCGFQGR